MEIATFLINAIITWVILRLSIALPSQAIEKPITLGDAWRATKRHAGSFFGLAILATLVEELPGYMPFLTGGGGLGTGLEILFQILCTGLLISLLTVLYAWGIEDRVL